MLEEQQRELHKIRRRQEARGCVEIKDQAPHAIDATLSLYLPQLDGVDVRIRTYWLISAQARGDLLEQARKGDANALALATAGGVGGGGGGGYSGPSVAEKKQAAQLMQSTETLMKFGFMSMSMTYFSSLNMIRAMRTVPTSA